MNGYFTVYKNKIILWGYFHDLPVPVWGWDSWEEVDTFIESLGRLREESKPDRDIPESILKEFE